ncbi:MAG TPA: hypothetical protein VH575_09195 [Gemmataceae bacterium]|jgi:hypothetical protein
MATSEDRPPDEETAIRLAKEMAARGLSPDEILQRLVAQGVNRGVAVFIVYQRSGAVDRVKRRAGFREMVVGGLILVVGLAVTAFSYLGADEAGRGRFIVAYGAILVGGAQFLRGLVLSRRS